MRACCNEGVALAHINPPSQKKHAQGLAYPKIAFHSGVVLLYMYFTSPCICFLATADRRSAVRVTAAVATPPNPPPP